MFTFSFDSILKFCLDLSISVNKITLLWYSVFNQDDSNLNNDLSGQYFIVSVSQTPIFWTLFAMLFFFCATTTVAAPVIYMTSDNLKHTDYFNYLFQINLFDTSLYLKTTKNLFNMLVFLGACYSLCQFMNYMKFKYEEDLTIFFVNIFFFFFFCMNLAFWIKPCNAMNKFFFMHPWEQFKYFLDFSSLFYVTLSVVMYVCMHTFYLQLYKFEFYYMNIYTWGFAAEFNMPGDIRIGSTDTLTNETVMFNISGKLFSFLQMMQLTFQALQLSWMDSIVMWEKMTFLFMALMLCVFFIGLIFLHFVICVKEYSVPLKFSSDLEMMVCIVLLGILFMMLIVLFFFLIMKIHEYYLLYDFLLSDEIQRGLWSKV